MRVLRHLLLAALPLFAASAQMPPIGTIDLYGVTRSSPARIREALGLQPGDTVPASRRALEQRIEAIDGISRAIISGVCCNDGKTALFVGIVEDGATPPRWRAPLTGTVRLPEDIVALHDSVAAAWENAVRSGHAEEDVSQGHSLVRDSTTRALQLRYAEYADKFLPRLRAVLRSSSDARHRAIAAEVIAYTASKADIVRDLVVAAGDGDDEVRNNAVRALALIAAYGHQHPEQRIRVPADPFVTMLYSPVWTDRNKASMALAQLTESRDATLLRTLRARAFGPLAEMARWSSKGHAMFPLLVLGRIGGMKDDAVLSAWQTGEVAPVIDAARKASR